MELGKDLIFGLWVCFVVVTGLSFVNKKWEEVILDRMTIKMLVQRFVVCFVFFVFFLLKKGCRSVVHFNVCLSGICLHFDECVSKG